MALILYFSLLFLSFVFICAADIVSSPWGQELVKQSSLPSSSLPTTEAVDPELLDIVLVASVDGKFRALNRTSGQLMWSMSGNSTVAALDPLVRTIHVEPDPDLVDDSTNQEIYIIEPQSGDIYVMSTPSSPLQRFPFSMSELVDMSPFSFSDSDDNRVFVGQKETSLLVVELETGQIKATLNSACPWDPFEDFQQADNELDLDELEGIKHKAPPPTEVFIGRTDYHISILRPPPRGTNIKLPPQKLQFSTYGPNNQDSILQASYRRPGDDSYIQSLPNGNVISFKAVPRDKDGPLGESSLLWGRQFDSPIIAVFDVLRRPSTRPSVPPHTFVLLQPRPGLHDLGPSLLDTSHLLPNLHSAYVGMIEENGSLFAMSPSKYPLVAFSDASRGTDRIDGSPGDLELPKNVDDVTRDRKYREKGRAGVMLDARCDQSTRFDRRCLIGVRKLQGGDGEGVLSRSRWLLDPPPEVPSLPVANSSTSTSPSPSPTPTTTTDRYVPLPVAGITNMWEAIVALVAITAISVWFVSVRSKATRVPGQESTIPVNNTLILDSEVVPEPIVSPEPVPLPSPRPPQLQLVDEPEESDREGEEDGGEMTPVSGRRKPRRGRRANKKKKVVTPGDSPEEEKKPLDAEPENQPDILVVSTPKAAAGPSLIVSETVLGFGSHGTVVYKGSLQGRAVAVKRLLQDFVTLASREVSILQESDDHPNVIRYYYQEAHANFLYIALELCPASLADIIECPDRDQFRDIAISFEPKKALKEITSGLRHLHALKLVHRDIKPQNILISVPKAGSGSRHGYRMLISDFGLCKKLEVDQTSFLPTAYGAQAAGTVGWRAPEILRGEVKLDELGDDQSISSSRGSTGTANGSNSARPTRLTKSVDIFALGCLFYYTLTNGSHPFGDRYEREVHILKNSKNLEGLERFGEEGSEGADLIERMLAPEAKLRPDTTTCLQHPFFWDSARRLNFLQDASDRFEIMCRDPKDPLLITLETNALAVVGNDWQSRVDKIFLDNLGKFRKYDGRSVQDLLRALRNKKHHYQDLPDNVKRHLGAMPEGYLSYFTRRYPSLFLHVHSVVRETTLRSESMFRSYFEVAD
ncbi:other/IRE protein kinase [Mycena floridula]|nr:other/IRE protein kinase [Mycena floridula]